ARFPPVARVSTPNSENERWTPCQAGRDVPLWLGWPTLKRIPRVHWGNRSGDTTYFFESEERPHVKEVNERLRGQRGRFRPLRRRPSANSDPRCQRPSRRIGAPSTGT